MRNQTILESVTKSPKVIVVSLSKNRRGGVAAVLSTLADAGFFTDRIIYHSSCGDGRKTAKLFSALRQWFVFLFSHCAAKPDLVHIHFSSDMSFWRKVPYIYSARIQGIKLLLHVHPSHFWDYLSSRSPSIRRFILAIFSYSDGLAFVSRAMVDRFRTIFPHMPIFYIENPIDLQRYKFCRSLRKEQALFLGAILKGKGVYDIVRAAPFVIAQRPHFKFILCGDHEIEKLGQVVVEQGLSEHFEINPWVGYEEKNKLLAESMMLLLPSFTEGFPIVVLEAMASGLPVITTPVGGMAERLQDGIQVLFTEPHNPAMLAEKILLLADRPDLQRQLSEQALQYAHLHDVKHIINKINKIYMELTVSI